MKKFLENPGFLADSSTFGADVSYLLAVLFTSMFIVAWVMAKKKMGTQHHRLIFFSMVSMLVYFVGYYYARSLGVLALSGEEGFGGPPETYHNVFVPILTTHLVLVTLGLILTPYMIIEGFRSCKKVDGKYFLMEGDLKVRPERFKSIMYWIIGIWAVNQALQSLLRGISWKSSLAYFLIFATIALVVSLEKLIEKLLPDGAKRHRALGRGTMIIFCAILVTSTLTYLMLYVIYPLKT